MSRRATGWVIAGLGALLLVSAVANVGQYVWPGRIGSGTSPPVTPDRIEVVRTAGGVLLVSTVHAPEYFTAGKDHTILGFHVGRTTSHIRVPATYQYGIELAREWKVKVQSDGTVIVIAPIVKPIPPVAIDTARLEGHTQGRWSAFTGAAELSALQRQITGLLEEKAGSASYLGFQRAAARKTVEEFVRTWLLAQERYRDVRSLQVRVFFADEPVSAMESALLGDP